MATKLRTDFNTIYEACEAQAIRNIVDQLKNLQICLTDVRKIEAGYGMTGFAGQNGKGQRIVVLCERSPVFRGLGEPSGINLQCISVLRRRKGCKVMRWTMQGHASTGAITEAVAEQVSDIRSTVLPESLPATLDSIELAATL